MRNYIKHPVSFAIVVSMMFFLGTHLSVQAQEIKRVFEVNCADQAVYIAEEQGGFTLIDSEWEPIIEEKYDTLSLLDEFLLSAVSEGKQVLLTCNGNPISPPDMESVYMYADDELRGLYFIRKENGKIGVMNYEGKIIIPLEFDRIEHLSIHKYLFGVKDNTKYYFDYMGNVLFK